MPIRNVAKVVREARETFHQMPTWPLLVVTHNLNLRKFLKSRSVDAVLAQPKNFRLVELLDGFVRPEKPAVFASDITEVDVFNSSYSLHDRTRTFLKVQDGCDYSCSFCTIPLARGSSRSDSIFNLVNHAKEIASYRCKGNRALTGVNTGDFGLRNVN
jgi:threonylcarbamoyladenosine tRNA methylthiotransferase MtaB